MQPKLAVLEDLENLFLLTNSCASYLRAQGIFQWNENYPSKAVLLNDINLKQIFKIEFNNEIIGCIVLSSKMDNEYKKVKWLTKNHKNLYIHRLAVLPKYQKRGYGKLLMDFAENFAVNNKYVSIRLDTFSKNKHNLVFYKNRNYTMLGSVFFPNQSTDPFYCFELVL